MSGSISEDVDIVEAMTVSLTELQQQAISVAGLTEYIQLLLEGDERLHQIWVVGEVSSAPQP